MTQQPPQPPPPPIQQPQEEQLNPAHTRKGMPGWAIALIVVMAMLAPIALLTSILLPGLGRARTLARRASSQANLNGIGKACQMYAIENRDANGVEQWPPTPQPLIDEGLITRKGLLYPGLNSGRRSDYFYLAPKEGMNANLHTLIACEYRDCNKGEGRAVLHVDGSVAWMKEPEFQAALARPENAEFAAALRRKEGQ